MRITTPLLEPQPIPNRANPQKSPAPRPEWQAHHLRQSHRSLPLPSPQSPAPQVPPQKRKRRNEASNSHITKEIAPKTNRQRTMSEPPTNPEQTPIKPVIFIAPG